MIYKKKVHFVGIGGSGMSGVAMIAKNFGYEVSGCDINTHTYYIDELRSSGIKIFEGQDKSHVKEVNLVAVTPAVFFQNKNHPEILLAQKENKLLTWQNFLGEYLQKDKEVICIAGTHGKSTTTAIASLLFEEAGFDPSVMIGANIPKWNGNFRAGKSEIFITEADEFFDNFLNYEPNIIILNNIEFDHPDYFKDENQVFKSFEKFIEKLNGKKILIYNEDDPRIAKLFDLLGNKIKPIKLVGYTTKGKKINLKTDVTEFEVDSINFKLKIPGLYNVSNALGIIALARLYKIPIDKIQKVLANFEGIGRRLELIGIKHNIKIYDDYAHHPTAIKKTLEALRQKYPKEKILAIIEPHTFSRTKALLPLYKDVFNDVNEIIIAPIFRSRDTEDFGISGNDIVKMSNNKNTKYIPSFDEIIDYIKENSTKYNVIIVMGAGDSYKLARNILDSL